MPLTEQKKLFVKFYLLSFNASAAARLAGYSVKTAGAQGSRLLKDELISEEVNKGIAEIGKPVENEKERWIERLKQLAYLGEATSTTMKALEMLGRYGRYLEPESSDSAEDRRNAWARLSEAVGSLRDKK